MVIPDAVRPKMLQGWQEHIPLTCLTDVYCMRTASDPKATQDLLTIDATSGSITTTSKALPTDGESRLTYTEWNEAWRCLLRLIEMYIPDELMAWTNHYTLIRDAEDCSTNWELWLVYNIEIRRRSCSEPLDPTVFHLTIWNGLQPAFLAKQAETKLFDKLRQELFQNNSQGSTTKRKASPDPHEYTSKRRRDFLSSTSSKNRCFLCGSVEHRSLDCRHNTLANGKPVFLKRYGSEDYRDSQGSRYCFGFNGTKGCSNRDNTCKRGLHRCTLCGGSHNAQSCNAI